MSPNDCRRDSEVLSAVRAGWCCDELREHIAGCGSCSQLFEVATLLFEEGRAATRNTVVPTSGAMWWRLELRRRRETSRRVSRTLTAVQAVSLAIALLIAVAMFGSRLVAEFTHLGPPSASTPSEIILGVCLVALALIASIGAWVSFHENDKRPVRTRTS